MQILKPLILVLLIGVITCACRNSHYPDVARFSVPGSQISVAIKRDATHEFLAEYERTLILEVSGKEKQRLKMFEDTGGYSRTNIFKISDSTYVLRDFDDDYKLNAANASVEKLEDDSFDTTRAVFVGAFDTDEDKVWRFIPAAEKSQMTTTMKSGGQ